MGFWRSEENAGQPNRLVRPHCYTRVSANSNRRDCVRLACARPTMENCNLAAASGRGHIVVGEMANDPRAGYAAILKHQRRICSLLAVDSSRGGDALRPLLYRAIRRGRRRIYLAVQRQQI